MRWFSLVVALLVATATPALATPPGAARTVLFRHREGTAPRATLRALSATRRDAVALSRRVSTLVSRVRAGRSVFTTSREMEEYDRAWPELREALSNASTRHGDDAHWLDLGAGDGYATAEHATKSAGRVTALSYRVGSAARMRQWRDQVRPRSPRSRFLVGAYLDEYTVDEIGQADVITDLFGPVSYVRQVDEAFHQLGLLTREGGDIFLRVNAFGGESFTGDGEAFLREWLGHGSGLEVVSVTLGQPRRGVTNMRVHLRRTAGPIRVRALELEAFEEGAPPKRAYRIGAGHVGDAAPSSTDG